MPMRRRANRLSGVALSNESADLTSGFAAGVEFEETFPESKAPADPAPEPVAPETPTPRLTVVRDEPVRREPPRREPEERRSISEQRRPVLEERAASDDRLDQRLRESETRIVARIELALEDWQHRVERRLRDIERALDERPARGERAAEREEHAAIRQAIATAASAREVGRIIRDAVAGIVSMSAFAVALHVDRGEEIAYRYRVATEDKLGDVLRTETLDDGPLSPAAYMDSWVRGQRAVRAGGRNFTIHTAQLAVRDGRPTIGVVTLQSADPLGDGALARIAELIVIAAPRLAELRDAGRFTAPRA
jgi:hypothetical protein